METTEESRNNKIPNNNKFIQGLNFRQITERGEVAPTNISGRSDGTLFIREIDTDIAQSPEIAVISKENAVKRFSRKVGQDFWPVQFVVDIVQYFAARTRVFFVLSSVFVEVLTNQFESSKRFMIRKMFWGRGNLFKFTIQFISVVFIVMIMVSGVYKQGSVPKEFIALTPGASPAYANDTIAQGASTKTISSNELTNTDMLEYIVKGGDTLSSIAEDNGISTDTIVWVNELTSANVLKPGQKLLLPRADGVLVEVKKGDTVATLADKYKTNPQLIIEWNWLDPDENGNYNINIGDELFLPDGKIIAPPVIATRRTSVYSGAAVTSRAADGYSNEANAAGRFLNWPVAGGQGYLSQCYSGWHRAIDIASRNVSVKPDLVAAADGVVTFAGCQSGYCPAPGVEVGGSGLAWTVMIDHGNGLTTVYGHMNQIYATSGQRVSAGESIGQMGRSGLAYGVHVHFVLVKTGTWSALNPAAYMNTGICGY